VIRKDKKKEGMCNSVTELTGLAWQKEVRGEKVFEETVREIKACL
jgi:hypothetical protein